MTFAQSAARLGNRPTSSTRFRRARVLLAMSALVVGTAACSNSPKPVATSAAPDTATAVESTLAASDTPESTLAASTGTEPTATEPTSTEPTSTEPTATEPTATEPTSTEPTSTEPTATEPVSGSASTTVTADLSAVKTFGKLSQNHVEGTVDYPQSPPVGGDHGAVWQNCGVYTAPVKNENAVHSLEHGAVWISYRPGLPAADIARLAKFAAGQTHVLVSPYPGLTSPIVLTAWSTQLAIADVNDPRIAAFVAKYQEGTQTPEPSAPCEGGLGTPQQ